MPDFQLPSDAKGWLIALISSLVGLLAGGLTIKLLRDAL